MKPENSNLIKLENYKRTESQQQNGEKPTTINFPISQLNSSRTQEISLSTLYLIICEIS